MLGYAYKLNYVLGHIGCRRIDGACPPVIYLQGDTSNVHIINV
jgi:hypothetical protein